MEINIIEEKKNRLVFEIKGGTPTLCNILKRELWKEDNVKEATYTISHPLVGIPKMIIETSKVSPRRVLNDAINRLKKINLSFEKNFKKEVK